MAIYEYKGQRYELPDSMSPEDAYKLIVGSTGGSSTPTQDESYLSSIISGATKGLKGAGKQVGLVSPESYKEAFDAAEASARINPIMTSIGQAAPKMVAGIGAALATGGTGLIPMAAGAATTGLMGGTERTSELQQQGVDPSTARTGGVTRGLLDTVGFAIPASLPGKVLYRAATGAGANIVTDQADVALQNLNLGDRYKALQGAQFDPVGMGIAGAFGGTVGAVVGPRPGQNMFTGEAKPKAKVKGSDDINLPPSTDVAAQEQMSQIMNRIERTGSMVDTAQSKYDAALKKGDPDKIAKAEAYLNTVKGYQKSATDDLARVQRALSGKTESVLGSEPDPLIDLETQVKNAREEYNRTSRFIENNKTLDDVSLAAYKVQQEEQGAAFTALNDQLKRLKADRVKKATKAEAAESDSFGPPIVDDLSDLDPSFGQLLNRATGEDIRPEAPVQPRPPTEEPVLPGVETSVPNAADFDGGLEGLVGRVAPTATSATPAGLRPSTVVPALGQQVTPMPTAPVAKVRLSKAEKASRLQRISASTNRAGLEAVAFGTSKDSSDLTIATKQAEAEQLAALARLKELDEADAQSLKSETTEGDIKAIALPDLKMVIFSKPMWDKMTPAQRKALDYHEVGAHIALKLERGLDGIIDLMKNMRKMRDSGNKVIQKAYDSVPPNTPSWKVDMEALGYLTENHMNLPIVRRIFREVIEYFRSKFSKEMSPTMVHNIIKGAYKEYNGQITRRFAKEGITDTLPPGHVRQDIPKALSSDPMAMDILGIIGDRGSMGGSAGLSLQGMPIYRAAGNPLHDMDFNVDSVGQRRQIIADIMARFPNAKVLREYNEAWEKRGGPNMVSLVIPRNPAWSIEVGLFGPNTSILVDNNAGLHMMQAGENATVIDLIVHPTKAPTRFVTVDVNGKPTRIRVAEKDFIYARKMAMGSGNYPRPKDIQDALMGGNVFRSETPVTQFKNLDNMIQESITLPETDLEIASRVGAGGVKDIDAGLLQGLWKRVIGKDQIKVMNDHPVVQYVLNVIKQEDFAKSRLTYLIMDNIDNSDAAAMKRLGKHIQNLRKTVDEKSLRNTLKQLTDMEGYQLHELSRRFFREGGDVSTPEALAALKQKRLDTMTAEGVPTKVIDAYFTIYDANDKLIDAINQSRDALGRSRIPKRADYYQAVRKGDYAVGVFHNDILYRVELFRSKVEAQGFVDKLEPFKQYTASKVIDIEAEKVASMQMDKSIEFVNDIFNQLDIDPDASGLMTILDRILIQGGKFGKHQEFRENIGGYQGSQWFKSKAELGSNYKAAVLDGISEQISIMYKNNVQGRTAHLLEVDPKVGENAPNAVKLAKHVRDLSTNALPEFGWAKTFDKSVRDFSDNAYHKAVKKMFGKESYPDVNPLDKTLGVGSTLFYLSTLTNRPGFWLSQLLTSPGAIRHLLRDTDMPVLDIIKHFSKGTFRAFGGMGAGKSWVETLHYIVNNTNTIHPLLQNEFTKINLLSPDATGALAKTMRVLTGQAPAEMADTFSRYWTASFMHEYYEAKGYKGLALHQAVANAVDQTMVLYDKGSKGSYSHEAGILGQQANPLMTFGFAQLGNLVADMRLMKSNPTKLRAYMPFLSTFLVTQLMAGAIGLPLVVEYEFLRNMIVKAFPEYDWLPSVTRIMMDEPAVIERGVVSAATGFDMGSGMRWNPFLNKFLLEDNQSLVDIFPVIAFMGSAGTAVAASFGDMTESGKPLAVRRQQMMSVVPMVGGKALIDELYFGAGTREMVPSGQRGVGLVEQTDKERLSVLIGSSTVEKARASSKEYTTKTAEAAMAVKVRKLVDQVTDGILMERESGNADRAIEKLAELNYNGTDISRLVREQLKKRVTTAEQRRRIANSPSARRLQLNVEESLGYETE